MAKIMANSFFIFCIKIICFQIGLPISISTDKIFPY